MGGHEGISELLEIGVKFCVHMYILCVHISYSWGEVQNFHQILEGFMKPLQLMNQCSGRGGGYNGLYGLNLHFGSVWPLHPPLPLLKVQWKEVKNPCFCHAGLGFSPPAAEPAPSSKAEVWPSLLIPSKAPLLSLFFPLLLKYNWCTMLSYFQVYH